MKGLVHEIVLIDYPISNDDQTLYVLNGLGLDFREIVASIQARETSLALEKLNDLFVGHKSYPSRGGNTAAMVATNYTQH